MATALATSCTSAPSEPTWTEDVAPIVAANCARCHGRVTRGGAPNTFRLDLYIGAQLMAPFMAARAHAETMPPVAPLAQVHIETLENWAANGAPEGEPVAGNQLPAIQIEGFRGDDTVTLPYVITDPDFDLVTGELVATPVGGGADVFISRDLHSGAGTVSWFVAAEEEGSYEIVARLRDGHIGRDVALGRFVVMHAQGNAAPKITVTFPPAGTILTDAASPLTVGYSITDVEASDTADVTVAMVRGSERVELATAADVPTGAQTIDIDTTGLAAGPNWTLVVEAGPSRGESSGLVVSHSTTTLTYADVQPILATYCDRCHAANPVVSIPFEYNFSSGYGAIAGFVSESYRRAVLLQSMPPRSAETLFDDFEPMPPSERARLAEWLVAGAPEN